MKALLVLAGATAALAAVPAAASACSCATVHHHKAHYSRPVHYAKPVRRAHYSRVVVRHEPVRTVYVTRVVRVPEPYPEPYGEPYPARAYEPLPPPPGPDMVVYRHHWRHHPPVYVRPDYEPGPDAEWAYPHDGWRADVNRY